MSISSQRSQFVFKKVERDLLRIAANQESASVHSFRTTTRRLQILLEELLPERNRNQKKLLKMLDRIRKRAGKVRDLDVQLGALRILKTPQEPRRKTQLTHSLLELRAKQEKKLRKPLTKTEIREIRKRLRRAQKDVSLENARDPLAVARQMLSRAELPAGAQTDETLHQYRIVVKRARYAAEFAPESAQAKQFIAQLKRLQDAIGSWHDWSSLTHTAAERLGDIGQSSLVAALHNVTGGKYRHALAALAGAAAQKEPGVLASVSVQSRKLATEAPALRLEVDSAA
jgi:CHAD domain-containing protein